MSEQTFPPLTLERARQLAAEVVADKGADYVYMPPDGGVRCSYSSSGEPSCLVGHVIHGWNTRLFEELGAKHEGDEVDWLPEGWFGPQVQVFLHCIQARQDDSEPWGDALEFALAMLDEPTDES
ncbi:hypothetical protein [Lentzea sp. E54]|uniref:hypothetical protein n=1 Tax=Lentzea xerophila TaxID=3435883 RepID=UPI003DA3BBA8